MELYAAGGCSEHGRNCFLVTTGTYSFLVDAGIMKEKPELPWPELDESMIRGASCVFLTHSHADHTGALKWLLEHGFTGKVAASRKTLDILPPIPAETVCLEDLAPSLREAPFTKDLSFMWGRSGHSVGSVWYRFRSGGRSILFSGDYEEQSGAYCCDCIRGISADAAVLDCAYGYEAETAENHLEKIRKAIADYQHRGIPLLFPVPSHGRGFDVIRLLAERGIRILMESKVREEYTSSTDSSFWFRQAFLDAAASADICSLEDGGLLSGALSGRVTSGILVRDSQLYRSENRRLAEDVIHAGGRVVLTGKQDPASFARTLLDRGDADFHRISVHQNTVEMLALAGKNHFGKVIPYHCRQQLSFDDTSVAVLKPGDRIQV